MKQMNEPTRDADQDLSSLPQLLQQFEPLIREKRFDKAHAVLDQALALLET